MGKSTEDKLIFARNLLIGGVPYREIQDLLKEKYGSGLSNTTLKNLQSRVDRVKELERKVVKTEFELEKARKEASLYKELYFELKDVIMEQMKK